MGWSDAAIIFATLFGPVFAIQVQKFIERRGAKRGKQEQIFFTLMATRAVPTSPGHVEALNAIPIMFYDRNVRRTSKEGRALEKINSGWRRLLHHFNDRANYADDQGREWERDRIANEVRLLKDMGDYLGFNFEELELENQHYFPVGQGSLIEDQEVIRRGLATVLSGKSGFPVFITGAAAPPPQTAPTESAPVPATAPANDAPVPNVDGADSGNRPAA
ncbi:hypothetical protein FOB72_06705 [Cupriavidus pauculus]|uniref:DUF6680 domain-containing protein n=1 Tax=Cupriavidus pauculus TaxID=82633 RepID=A0A5P2H2K1_9BURK|nr:DUF6680 family protein [Cupriavidus pauculus]QET01765.1 hypothetical protein FOB72_06705 [Cupriavidus pauculus]